MVLPDVTRAYICLAGGIPSLWHLEVGQAETRKRTSFTKQSNPEDEVYWDSLGFVVYFGVYQTQGFPIAKSSGLARGIPDQISVARCEGKLGV